MRHQLPLVSLAAMTSSTPTTIVTAEKGSTEREVFIQIDPNQTLPVPATTKIVTRFIIIISVVAIFGSGVLVGSYLSAPSESDGYYHNNSPIASHLRSAVYNESAGDLEIDPSTEPSMEPSTYALQQIKRQLSELKDLACHPTPQVLKIKTILPPNDQLMDRDFYPEDKVVRRCVQESSYCPTGNCLPTGEEWINVMVVYDDEAGENHYEERSVLQHTGCSCQQCHQMVR